MTLSLRYTRIAEGPMYAISTAVIVSEILKLLVCILMVCVEQGSIDKGMLQIKNDMKPVEIVKVAVPFDVVLLKCIVCQLIPVIYAALFSVSLLSRQLSWMQWWSLILLCIGVAVTQLSTQASTSQSRTIGNPVAGFVAVFVAAVLSGFAGVYFEKILKASDVSLWVRNVQMCVIGIPIGFATMMYSNESPQIMEHGPFYGYTWMVAFVIVVQAVGGLLVAAVVKYADNILKGFATSMSLIMSLLVSMIIFEFQPTLHFTIGAILVNASTFIYMNYGISTPIPTAAPVTPRGTKTAADTTILK